MWRFPVRYGIGTLKLNLSPLYNHYHHLLIV
jgi:hypothetical protein